MSTQDIHFDNFPTSSNIASVAWAGSREDRPARFFVAFHDLKKQRFNLYEYEFDDHDTTVDTLIAGITEARETASGDFSIGRFLHPRIKTAKSYKLYAEVSFEMFEIVNPVYEISELPAWDASTWLKVIEYVDAGE